VLLGTTMAFASPTLFDEPLKVTRAFSETHEIFAALKRERMVVEESGMEKFVCAAWINRGIESPSVTLVRSLERVAVVQPIADAMVQVLPVKPFVQIHAHAPDVRSVVPPF